MPLNKVWFLTYFCLYLFLYTSYRLYTYPFIISLVHNLQFIVHRIFINFHINTFTHLPIYTSTHSHLNTTTTANILPQEGTAQGFYLYGGGGILPVAIVFIVFLCSIVRWNTTIVPIATIAIIATFFYGWYRGTTSTGEGVYVPPVEDTAGGTGVYLYGGRGMSPLPPCL